ncbi:superoxide dismutase family protein [Stappia sp. P2PMeth1]|uniref:superoxide dismutase family protein n=1 Tax=Stappia sp. P2PMeth1 TaxID=2003586 RepID=UPI00164559AD|nr:superoxide dismutase family protein [Stappia sp. P2PMeth1]
MKTLMIASLLAATALPAFAQDQNQNQNQNQNQGQDRAQASATFVNQAGEENGKATLTETPGGVLIELEVTGLPAEQWVAFHVHETGTCDAQTGHESAGGHFNPTDASHGYLAEGGPHAGDMPNQWVDAGGTLRAQVFNAMVSLDGDNAIRGRALMIHGGEDDYISQPTGDAGDRQACAVID